MKRLRKILKKKVLVDWESEFPLQYENNISKNVLVHNLAGYIVKNSTKE